MMTGTMLALRVLLSLACVVGLIWILGRKMAGTQARRVPVGPTMRVVGRQPLGRHAGVAVVAVGNRRLLLGYGEQQVTMLTELAPVVEPVLSSVTSITSHGATAGTGHLGGRGLPVSLTGFVSGVGDRLTGRSHARPAPGISSGALLGGVPAPRPEIDVEALLAQAHLVPVPGAEVRPIPGTPAPTTAPALADASNGPLAGSILSPTTWRRAVGVLQDRTVRR